MTALGYGILAAAIVLCAAAVWCERQKTRRALEKLNEMLTDAMQGDFTEDSFDETLLPRWKASWRTTSRRPRYPPGTSARKRKS